MVLQLLSRLQIELVLDLAQSLLRC